MLMICSFPIFGKTITLSSKNTINFNQAFTPSFVAKKQLEAIKLCYSTPNSEIYVVLYTPGGSVSAGQLFFDTLNALPCKFNTVTIFSASMGYITVQSLHKRYILPSGTLMSHRASIKGLGGEIGGELDQIYNLLKTNITEINKKVSSRIGITLKKYEDLISDELWLTGESAVKNNHADSTVLVKCDDSLLGTYTQTVRSFFGQFTLEFSRCPIITAPITVKGNGNVKKLFDYYNNIHKYVVMEL
jgi:ATP-dependent Clp protease protease subunit